MIDEERVREKLEAVNSLLDKLIPAVDSGTWGVCKEIPDLIGHKRENSELTDILPHMAKNMEGSLKDLILLLRSRHRTNYAQVSSGCLDFQDHNHQLKSNFMKNMHNIFCDIYLVVTVTKPQQSKIIITLKKLIPA